MHSCPQGSKRSVRSRDVKVLCLLSFKKVGERFDKDEV